MHVDFYDNKTDCSCINFNASCFVVQSYLAQCFEFLHTTEGYQSDAIANDTVTPIKQDETRIYFFTQPNLNNVRISALIGNLSMSRTLITVSIIDPNYTLSWDEKKRINLEFANALYFYYSNTIKDKNSREKFSSNGCAVSFLVIMIILFCIFFCIR